MLDVDVWMEVAWRLGASRDSEILRPIIGRRNSALLRPANGRHMNSGMLIYVPVEMHRVGLIEAVDRAPYRRILSTGLIIKRLKSSENAPKASQMWEKDETVWRRKPHK